MTTPIQLTRRPLVYLITDRVKLAEKTGSQNLSSFLEFVKRALAAGVDLVQIRERDLSTRDLLFVTQSVAEAATFFQARVLVNDRADVAAACPGVGVHLTTHSMTADVVRRTFGRDMLIGASTHCLEEAQAAERGGADFAVFGPVFETESKKKYGPPVGLAALQTATAKAGIPVLALGGINTDNFTEALRAGAAGVAGISLFIEAQDIEDAVRMIKSRVA